MTGMHFVDTNILVYLHDSKEPEKQERATRIIESLWRHGSGRLSFQVLSEFYAVATRKLKPGLAPDVARQEVRDLMNWDPQPPSAELFDLAWQIEDRWQLSWWDSLIVASALLQDCQTLLTEDLQNGLEINGLRILNPFTPEFDPATLYQ
jgi:predicted nucleic acid-binding protein